MSADRELLELAAKAAGFDRHVWREDAGCMQQFDLGVWHLSWNPLTDDGDALRLAVTLNIDVNPDHKGKKVFAPHAGNPWAEGVRYSDDVFAATRRAIVRSAAEIGEAMP